MPFFIGWKFNSRTLVATRSDEGAPLSGKARPGLAAGCHQAPVLLGTGEVGRRTSEGAARISAPFQACPGPLRSPLGLLALAMPGEWLSLKRETQGNRVSLTLQSPSGEGPLSWEVRGRGRSRILRSAPDRHLAAFLEPRGNSGVNCLSFLALDVYSVSVRFTRAKAFKRSIGEAMRWGEKRKGREEGCSAGSLRPRSPTTDVSTIGVERSPTGCELHLQSQLS